MKEDLSHKFKLRNKTIFKLDLELELESRSDF